jgi:dTDP-glucose 4,6-dehydratase
MRLFHVYGPWESAHRLAPTALRCALEGVPLSLAENSGRRDWVYVNDVCEALVLGALAGHPGEIFNIGSGVEASNEDLVSAVQSVTGRMVRRGPSVFGGRVTDALHRFAAVDRARDRLGWEPRHDLRSGLRATLDWYHAHPSAWAQPDDHWGSQV